jgi:sulfur transfer complex TusBCD TusB component (DsrH family)
MTDINLLFTCPHDGRKRGSAASPPILKRDRNNFPAEICPAGDGEGFNDENDLSAKDLTEKIAENIQSISTMVPHVKIAEFRREFIDYNRKDECAFEESSSAHDEYWKYHNEIKATIEKMLSNDNSSLAFLFDIHGTGRRTMRGSDEQSHEIEAIIGTQEGQSIHALNQKNPKAWWGDKGLIPLLQTTKNVKTWPPNANEEEHSTLLDGGHTIETYSKIDRVVAIQIEVICALRENVYCSPCRDIFASDLAECIFEFARPFIGVN